MERRGAIIGTAIVVFVSCVLLFYPLPGTSDYSSNHYFSAPQKFGHALLSYFPSFLLGISKTPPERLFPHKNNQARQSGKLSVFRGREAKQNLAIILALTYHEPQTTRALWKKITHTKGMKDISYSTINRRVRNLEQQLYLKKAEIKQRLGGITNYYELRPKAYLAKFLDSTNMETVVEQVNDKTALTLLAAFIHVQELSLETEE